jgi:hypothetical protein
MTGTSPEELSMFRNFFEVKGELLAKGETFSAETLRLISYEDLVRAAIGDAGATACDVELVEEERNIRLNSASSMTVAELVDQKMAEDVLMRIQMQKLEALPRWDQLTPAAQIYFRVKCLRAHMDNPLPRLSDLIHAIPDMDEAWEPLRKAALHLYFRCDHPVPSLNEPLTLQDIRAAFKGKFEMIPKSLNPWERMVCQSMSIQGYTCTAGCFLPATYEG